MKAVIVENELRDVISRIISQVEASTKQNRYDVNLILEDGFIPILKTIFTLDNLINLNRKSKNYPGIDLGDEFDRVAFQITSTSTLDKVKKTLGQFVDKGFERSFNELYILILTKKQASYSQNSIDQVVEGRFNFNAKDNIIDLYDLLEKIAGLRVSTQERILNEFKLILGDVESQISSLIDEKENEKTLLTNLISVEFLPTIYVAELTKLDDKGIVEEARVHLNFKKYKFSKRTVVKLALLLRKKTTDAWLLHENKIFTFINLNRETDLFIGIIDYDSIETIDAQYMYESGVDDNMFILKNLLMNTTQESLKVFNLNWSSEEKIFYFYSEGENRSESWVGKKKATRKVYEVVKSKKDPEKTSHHKHLSFKLSFLYIGNMWYANVTPTWLYTYNGYRKSIYHEDLLSKQKRLEFNSSVKNMTRFIAYFLHSSFQDNIFGLNFGKLVEITSESGAVLSDAYEPDDLDMIEEEEL